MARPEEKAERYQKALLRMVGELQRKHINPLMKESFLCSAACCDLNDDRELQRCLDNCQQRAQAAKEFIENRMQDFQARMQRCMQRCQDLAQESLPPNPTEKDIFKAQDKLANCLANCAVEYEGKLDAFKVDIASQLSKATSIWQNRN
ncbi:probable protein FAM136A [Coccomyxa sp. Obi]|nr:probable protein FAM136A [Coccomyxa sp. Obi]